MSQCLNLQTILDNGVLNENQDGTVSVYMPNGNVLGPVTLTEQCCLALNNTYSWDSNAQRCMWDNSALCSLDSAFKITLNPNGNEAVLFSTEPNKTCALNIEFDYLFKIKCETLDNILLLTENPNGSSPYADILGEIALVESLIETQTVNCEMIANEISSVQYSIENTDYSIEYEVPNNLSLIGKSNKVKVTSTNSGGFVNTGFSAKDIVETNTKTILAKTKTIDSTIKELVTPLTSSQQTLGGPTTLTYCIVNPVGLSAWQSILGSINYQLFLNGDPNSYTVTDVEQLLAQNDVNINSNPQQPQLVYACTTPFGTLTDLLNQLDALEIQQENCQTELLALNTQLSNLQTQLGALLGSGCTSPINFFESLDVSLNVDVVTSSGTTVPVYEDTTLFPQIGLGNLYNYLTATGSTLNTATGFYVCGGDNCDPMYINSLTSNTCLNVYNSLINALYVESGLIGISDYTQFLTTLPNDSFVSNWLHHSLTITDESVLTAITNQNITVSLNINHSCGNICILLDNLKINKECSVINEQTLFITESPGFKLERIRDNKKSWIKSDSYQNRYFDLTDVDDTNPIRITNYNVNDERLIINTKEIDLDINIANAMLTDIWSYSINNPCILTGVTNCDQCGLGGYKQFQDGEYFEFMDGEAYEFMDTDLGSVIGVCCGDDLIDFNDILSTPISGTSTVEEFFDVLQTELIDVKNRQTISAYPTLRALYDRYLNSYVYCGNNSSAFNYITIDNFANLLTEYWSVLIEQVVPSTTIWGSVKVYSNSLFDSQKFKYKGYTTLFNNNPFYDDTIPSPLNGVNGEYVDVDTDLSTIITSGNTVIVLNNNQTSSRLWAAQMNSSNEFIGRVTIINSDNLCTNVSQDSLSECSLQVDVVVSGNSATANLTGASNPVTYTWSNGETTQTATFNLNGTYTLVVTDSKCCTVEKEITISF